MHHPRALQAVVHAERHLPEVGRVCAGEMEAYCSRMIKTADEGGQID